MEIRMRLLLMLVLATAARLAVAGETLMLGEVKQVVIQAPGFQACPGHVVKHGDTIAVSNHCGCIESTVDITKLVTGQATQRRLVANNDLGEWCRTEIMVESTLPVFMDAAGNVSILPLGRDKDRQLVVMLGGLKNVPDKIANEPGVKETGTISLDRLLALYRDR
jgi:hypothetical protein